MNVVKEYFAKRKKRRLEKKTFNKTVRKRIKTGRFDGEYTLEMLEHVRKRGYPLTPSEQYYFNNELGINDLDSISDLKKGAFGVGLLMN
ncbi:hypothetical protein AGMMS50284_1860 [Clostridia bacterium]|nr:hypothetical protein AGMMS50284_1860 [Clostridia bacterium]